MNVRKKTSVAPKSITEFSKGELEGQSSRRSAGKGGRSSRITAQRINPRLLGPAMKIAGRVLAEREGAMIDDIPKTKRMELIQLLGGEGVIIHNNPNWKRR